MSVCSSLVAVVDRGDHQVVQFCTFLRQGAPDIGGTRTEAEKSLSNYQTEPARIILAHASLSIVLDLDDEIDRDTIAHLPLTPYAARHWADHAQFMNVSSHAKDVMKPLFDPAKPHLAAWVWLHDMDRHWIQPMPTMRPTQPEAVPLYYATLCGFVGPAGHRIATNSRDINSKGGSHTTPLHAASVKGHFRRASQGGQLVPAKSSLEIARPLVNSGADVSVTDDEGCAPLHGAARFGHREFAELLLGSGVSLDAPNKIQDTLETLLFLWEA